MEDTANIDRPTGESQLHLQSTGYQREAADQMLARIKNYAENLGLDVDNLNIIIQAYAHFGGLGKACIRKVEVKDDADPSLFANGVMQRHGLFEFVDAGPERRTPMRAFGVRNHHVSGFELSTDNCVPNMMTRLLYQLGTLQTCPHWCLP